MSAFIPYIDEPHPDTGVTNAKLGTWLFLASEVMLFGALFSTYVMLRSASAHWPHGAAEGLSVPLALINTAILITSSVTMVMAWASLAKKDFMAYRANMGYTILLALGFLGVKAVEYGMKFGHGIFPAKSPFFALYFTMTGLHAIHVIGGIVVNSWFWGPGSAMWKTQPVRFMGRVECAGLYWHFVDLVWIFLFPVLYLL
jgi:heme/copper-type cytochrome/quinol oxidase subunit 3